MTVLAAGSGKSLTVRAYSALDQVQVLDLVTADRLLGKPAVTARMLDDATAGRCPADPELWAGLEELATDVLVSADGQIVGVVSFAVRARGAEGVLLWMHCREEDQHLAGVLIAHTLSRFGRRTVHAFKATTALSFAGLPVGNRPGTHRALESAGFSRRDGWSYLHHRLDIHRRRPRVVSDITETDPATWHVHMRDGNGASIGMAVIGRLDDMTAVLEWIALRAGGYNLGHILLEQCLAHLTDRGMRDVITFLEAPAGTECPYSPARELHHQAGFREIDQLHAYTRRP
ncbi:GNAT family N-acetyltransferase [Streptomyces sp. NPDC048419]|uniref:GNAT family N-acetyltransferase n=1 Tax=Streptomyces sp. NPDC048419 TaxID=3365547 RepID=UPI0037247628